jgi:hypothetical protein
MQYRQRLRLRSSANARGRARGGGAPRALRNADSARATRELFKELLRRGKDAKRQGIDVDRARDAMMPEIADLMIRITGNTGGSNDAFKMQMVD